MPKILIVDDDPDMVLEARIALENGGYDVLEAHSTADGLQKIRSEHPDLIVLEVMMETTTAGFQTALVLRNPDPNSEYAAFRSIPIVMLTSIHETTNLRFDPDDEYLPVDVFIDKPINPEQFLAAVQALLERQ